MNIQTPHIITEKEQVFSLGKLNGRLVVYDFSKILSYLNFKGKLLYGTHFKIHKRDYELVYTLANYMIKNKAECERLGLDLNKGILLTGPEGCGKTSLMKLIKYIVPHFKNYQVVHCRNLVFAYNNIGSGVIPQYGDAHAYCFDGLGTEAMGKYFKTECHVIKEILLSRYELYVDRAIKTHATTSLIADELEAIYGSSIRRKMRLMFNLVAYKTD